jgi:hypothetical protein
MIMPRIPISELPNDARLWVFPLSRALGDEEGQEVRSRVDAFLEGWAAHGSPLTAGREWVEGRFLFIAVDENSVPPSGCSIDDMARVLKEEGARLGMSFLDHAPVWYRQGSGLRQASRGDFQKLVEEGVVGLETPVLDTAITRLSQFRSGDWEKPAGASWHRRAFFPKEDR